MVNHRARDLDTSIGPQVEECVREAEEYLDACEIEGLDIAFNVGEDIRAWKINTALNAVSGLLRDAKTQHGVLVAQVKLHQKLRTSVDISALVKQVVEFEGAVMYYAKVRYGLLSKLDQADTQEGKLQGSSDRRQS